MAPPHSEQAATRTAAMMERSRPDRSAVDSALCAWQGESSALREIIDKWLIVWRSGGSVSAQAQVVVPKSADQGRRIVEVNL